MQTLVILQRVASDILNFPWMYYWPTPRPIWPPKFLDYSRHAFRYISSILRVEVDTAAVISNNNQAVFQPLPPPCSGRQMWAIRGSAKSLKEVPYPKCLQTSNRHDIRDQFLYPQIPSLALPTWSWKIFPKIIESGTGYHRHEG